MSLVVKAHQPWKTRILLGLGMIALVILGYALFEYGRFSAGYDSIEADEEHDVLLKRVDELEENIDE
ncbi:MAG: hypothetical protein PVG20_08605, partial [Thioalkalispiraceae bacterium]